MHVKKYELPVKKTYKENKKNLFKSKTTTYNKRLTMTM